MKIREDFEKMTPYERYKLKVDFLRFIATIGAPFMIVLLSHITKQYLGW
jgi:hypothetical protein